MWTRQSCSVTVKTDKQVSRFLEAKGKKEHDHKTQSNEELKKKEIRQAVKRKASEDVHTEPSIKLL